MLVACAVYGTVIVPDKWKLPFNTSCMQGTCGTPPALPGLLYSISCPALPSHAPPHPSHPSQPAWASLSSDTTSSALLSMPSHALPNPPPPPRPILLIHGLIVQIDLIKLFPQHMWLFPSTAYLASGAGSATAWRVLFKALGFTDFIQAPAVALRLTPDQKAASHWAGADLGPVDASGHHVLQDWSADEFKAVVSSLQKHCKDKDALQTHCAHLVHCIDALWEDDFAGCVSVQPGSEVTGKLLVGCCSRL